MTPRRQSLRAAIKAVHTGRLHVTGCGLAGCPVGGWPETLQALRRIEQELPRPSERIYTVAELVDALYERDHAERYRLRGAAEVQS